MRRSRLEMRSKKYPARQFVSETHDHKAEAKPRPGRVGPDKFQPLKKMEMVPGSGFEPLTS